MSFIIFIDSQPQPTSVFAISHCFLGCTHWDKYSPSLNWTLDRRGEVALDGLEAGRCGSNSNVTKSLLCDLD